MTSLCRYTALPLLASVVCGAFSAAGVAAEKGVPVTVPDFTIALASKSDSVGAGGRAILVLTVANRGAADAKLVRVEMPRLPGAFLSASATNHFACFPPKRTRRTYPLRCVGGRIPAGGKATITVQVTVAIRAGTYPMRALVDPHGAIAEDNEANNSASGEVVVPKDLAPDLRVSIAGWPPTVLPGELVTFRVEVRNGGIYEGPVLARTMLPPGVGFVSATATGGFGCAEAGGVVTCSSTTLHLHTVATLGITGRASSANGTVAAQAVVDPDNLVAEADEENNRATASVAVTNLVPDMTVGMTSAPSQVGPGALVTHTVTVRNVGSADATDVLVAVPELGGTYVSATATGGFACTAPVRTYFKRPGKPVTCTGALPAGGTVAVTVVVVAPAAARTYQASARVGLRNGQRELGIENNSASSTLTVS